MSIYPVNIPTVHRVPNLIGRALFGDVDNVALNDYFEEVDANIDSFYYSLKEQEFKLQHGEETAFNNPANRAFAWMELIEHVLLNNLEGAREFFKEAIEKGIFDVEGKIFELPKEAEKVSRFLDMIYQRFEEENEAHFSPLVEGYEEEVEMEHLNIDAENRSSPQTLEQEIEILRHLEQRKAGGKQGWQRV